VSINSAISWSSIAASAVLLAYIVLILPGWFKRPSPAIFAPVDFVCAGVYLWYVDFYFNGGWFWSFALPICGGFALIVCSVVILRYYLRCGYLYIFGGATVAMAFFSVLVEFLIHNQFAIKGFFHWSIYPFIVFLLIGIMLIVIAIVRPLRESLHKIFAI
jgi:hypothetical protein